jgi:hypothetical protein
MRTLKIKHNVPNPLSVADLVPRFKDFGEDVWRALHDECEVSIDEIDHAIAEFHIRRIHKREIRNVTAKVRKILEKKYPMLPPIDIVEVEESNNV